jgi:hypothetical protein
MPPSPPPDAGRPGSLDLIETPITAALVRGAADLERTDAGRLPHRLPAAARKYVTDPQLLLSQSQASGVRVVFRTAATVVELEALPTRNLFVGGLRRPPGVYELFVDGEPAGQGAVEGGNVVLIDPATGVADPRPGAAGTVRFAGLPERVKEVEIWLPYGEVTELVALRANAPVEPAAPSGRPIWLHHGSSISHGTNAASSATTWPAVAAAAAGLELVNLGFGGSALLDPFTARTIRAAPADVISLKLGINLVNHDVMRLRAFTPAVHGFLDTVREGHPDTPILVVSPIYCGIHEHTPGPTAMEMTESSLGFHAEGDPADVARGKLTLTVIRAELARILAQRAADDPNLHHLDGLALYGEADAAGRPLPDGLHPDAATHRHIGRRFAELVFGPGGPLSGLPGT